MWLRLGRDQFEEYALPHLDALYRTAVRLTRNRAQAEDLVQEAYLRAFRKFHRFQPGTNCRAWLFTIMRRLFLNSLRDRDREQLANDPDSCPTSAEVSATAPAGATFSGTRRAPPRQRRRRPRPNPRSPCRV